MLWEGANHICSRRLQPFIPELLAILEQHKEVHMKPEVAAELIQMSASTQLSAMMSDYISYAQLESIKGGKTSNPLQAKLLPSRARLCFFEYVEI